ncbi:hypothetical protein pSALSNUABM04_127 [Salmonella phage pSal-SNUABM-04]|nr:hypothetical protein pSALSNUABM04_127 [Salmonella phage pSal-SNUABM-04]
MSLIDVTVKSGIKALAPTWDFLMEYKNSDKGPEAEDAYTKKYKSRIQQLKQDDPDVMLELLYQDEIILMCYCPAGKFCHRLLLVDEFKALGDEHNVEVIYEGEIT